MADSQQVRDDAKKWGVTGGRDLAARVEEHIGKVRDALNALDHQQLQDVADGAGVAHDAGQDRFEIIESLMLHGVPLDDIPVVAAESGEDRSKKELEVTPAGTVWLYGGGAPQHVEVGSPAYEDLIAKGYQPGDAPEDADEL